MKTDAAVFDLDGVVCDNSHRRHLYPKCEVEFYSLVEEDQPMAPMIKLIDMLYWDMSYEIILLTSRPDYAREGTENWLKDNDVSYTQLIMRPKDNEDPMWKTNEIKKLKVDHRIQFVFDDHPEELALFSDQGFSIIPIRSKNFEGGENGNRKRL